MEGLQERFMRVLDERASDEKLELVVNYNYSNNGLIYLMKRGEFDSPVGAVPFKFYSGRVALGWTGKNNPHAKRLFPGRPNPFFAVFQADAMEEALDAMIQFAMAADPA
jgi:hypothetical protein